VVVVRPLGQGRQIGAFGQAQVGDRLAEIVVGGRPHPIGAVAQPDLVQIEFKDLLLVERLLQAVGENGVLQLAADGGVVGQEDVLGHLLGDGGAAFQPAPTNGVEQVLGHGAHNAAGVHAAVLEEAVVLGRQEGLGQLGRDVVIGDEDPALAAELADQGAVPGIGPRGGGRAVVHQVPGVGHVVEQPRRVDGDGEPRRSDCAQHGDAGDRDPSLGGVQD
jgi:hypothetical protein